MSSDSCLELDLSQGSEAVPIAIEDIYMLDGGLGSFNYTKCNIPGPKTDTTDFEIQLEGCSCENLCEPDTCPCLKFGRNFNSCGVLINRRIEDDESDMPIIECNSECICNQHCSNRVVQRGVQCKLQVFDTKSKGLGVRCLQDINQGTFVCEYAGEVLTTGEAKRRIQSLSGLDSNYIFVLSEHSASVNVLRTYIDPRYVGNVGRFINHSCEPNLVMFPVRFNNNVPKLALFAACNIKSEEEVCYDYSGGEKLQQKISNRKICHCHSQKCTGFLPTDPTLFYGIL